MKRLLILLVLSLATPAMAAIITQDESTNDSFDTSLTMSFNDFKYTLFNNWTNQNLMNTELYGWGNHALAGYLTNYVEADPLFVAWDKDYNDLINRPTIPTNTDNQTALQVPTDTTNFDSNLSSADTDVQKALETLDGLTLGGDGSALEVENDSTSIDTAVTKINFIGSGVTAVENADHEIDVTVASGGAPVDSVNSQTGTVVLGTDDISDSAQTNKYVTISMLSDIEDIDSNTSGVSTNSNSISNHTANTSNPHYVRASNTPFTPDGSIAATTVQAAIVEVRDEAGAQDLSGYAQTSSLGTAATLDTGTDTGDVPVLVDDGGGNPALNFALFDASGFSGIFATTDDTFDEVFAKIDALVTGGVSTFEGLTGTTATTTEVNYTDGVTSSIQTQIDNLSLSGGGALPSATYSDDTCTANVLYSRASDGAILKCIASGNLDLVATLTDWDSPAPTTYTLALTLADLDGDSVNSVSVAGPTNITGLSSATYALTETFGSINDTVVCTGAAVTGSANNYLVDMSDSNESATCTFSVAGGSCSASATMINGAAWADWWSISNGLAHNSYQQIQNAASITICRVDVSLEYSSAETGIHIEIRSLDRATKYGDSSDTVTITSADTPASLKSFTWSNGLPNPTGDYAIVLVSDTAVVKGSVSASGTDYLTTAYDGYFDGNQHGDMIFTVYTQ